MPHKQILRKQEFAMKNIYVGNFSFATTETQLREIFEHYGAVQNINLIRHEYTGKPRGFAFVEMPDDSQGLAAITAVNGSQLGGRVLVVNEARPKTERDQRGSN